MKSLLATLNQFGSIIGQLTLAFLLPLTMLFSGCDETVTQKDKPPGPGDEREKGEAAFIAIWENGTGEQWIDAGLSPVQFENLRKDYIGRGILIHDLELRGGQYSVVWRAANGNQQNYLDISPKEFEQLDRELFEKGFRIHDLEIREGRFYVVWRSGTGPQRFRTGMTWDEFAAQDQEYLKEGLRIHDLELSGGYYSAVWRPGNGLQWIHTGISAEKLESQNEEYESDGLHLVELEHDAGGYCGVWQPRTGEQQFLLKIFWDEFASYEAVHITRGLRLRDIELANTPRALYKLPFPEESGWRVSNGNWDDPGNSHAGGNQAGLQAYAFDFTRDQNGDGAGDEGAPLLAARGGTVRALVESENQNSAGDTNLCIRGVGNYLVIDHGDSTFSVYWHMTENGVLVDLGDEVAQGDPIGNMGNTGNSSGPHLHFEVRTGWDPAYSCSNLSEMPSIKIMFQSKDKAGWIPLSGETVVSNQ